MDNHLFDAEQLSLLTEPEKWKVVSSFFRPDIRPVGHPGREKRKWRMTHTHRHSHVEFLFAFSGITYYGLAENVYPCRAGSLLVFDAYEPHDLGYSEVHSRARHLWISGLPGKLLVKEVTVGQYVRSQVEKINLLVPQEETGLDLCRIVNYCRERKDLPESVRKTRLVSAIQSLMSYIVGCGYGGPSPDRQSFQDEVIETICEHIRVSAGRGVSAENMARLAGYSKFHFLRIFKQHTGRTLHQFVDECRIHRVEILTSLGRSQKEISSELGFSCLAAFSRWKSSRMSMKQ